MPVLIGKVCGGPGPAVMLISARVEPQPAVGVLRACGSESTASWHAVSHILDVHARSFPLLRLTSRLPCRMCKDNRHVYIALIQGSCKQSPGLVGYGDTRACNLEPRDPIVMFWMLSPCILRYGLLLMEAYHLNLTCMTSQLAIRAPKCCRPCI